MWPKGEELFKLGIYGLYLFYFIFWSFVFIADQRSYSFIHICPNETKKDYHFVMSLYKDRLSLP